MDTSYISPKVRELFFDSEGSFTAEEFLLKNLVSHITPSLYNELAVVLHHLVEEKKLVKSYTVDRKKFYGHHIYSSISIIPNTLRSKLTGEFTPVQFSDLHITYSVVENG